MTLLPRKAGEMESTPEPEMVIDDSPPDPIQGPQPKPYWPPAQTEAWIKRYYALQVEEDGDIFWA